MEKWKEIEWYDWEDNLFWWSYTDNNRDTSNKWRHWIKWKLWKDNHSSKVVIQYSLSWEFIKEWWSTREIEIELKISHGNISSCCNWNRESSWWFKWSYTNITQ